MPVSFLICLINSAALTFGIFFELKETVHVHVKAIGDLIELKGSIVGEILTIEAKLFVIDFTGKEGLGNVKECKDVAGNILKTNLLSLDMLKEKEFLELSLSLTAGLLQLTETQKLMDT